MKMGSQSNIEWRYSAAARHRLSTMLKCYYRCNCTVFLIAVTFTHNHHCPLMLLVSLSCSSMTLLTLKLMISQGHLLSYELNAHLSFLCFSASRGRVRFHVNLEGFWEGQRYKKLIEMQENAQIQSILRHLSSHRWCVGLEAIICWRGLPFFLSLLPPHSSYPLF